MGTLAPSHRCCSVHVALSGAVLREAALAVTGRRSRDVPMFATLVTGAALASVALPGLRRAAQKARAAEQRVRQQRIGRYSDAIQAARAVSPTAHHRT